LQNNSASCALLNFVLSNSVWFRRALAVVAGVAWALSFQKLNIAGLAWIAPAVILLAARGGNNFKIGYLAGFTHYLISLSWLLHIPVKFYPILGWIALAAYLALYPAVWAWLSGRNVENGRLRVESWNARAAHALLCAAAWVALEMIVARLFSGFPWNLLGSSQQRLFPLIQVASWTGVYGVSFLVVWFSVSLLNALDGMLSRPTTRHVWLKELSLPIFTIAVIYAVGLHRITSESKPARTLQIALVQPSIPQTMIWNANESDARFAELLRLTVAALTNKPDVLIWPEAAVPKMVRDDEATARAIAGLAASNSVWLIIGSDDFDFRGTNTIFFNSSFLVSPRGEFISTYRKRRLVIFGEYVPLVDWLPFIKYLTPITGGFAAGERPVTFDLGALGVKTSVLICFEDMFPHYAREHAASDVDFLVNLTNDGWFGESAAQWQQAASAAFRAVENGRPLVRCANNGISCWIDRFGRMNNVFFENSRDVYQAGFKLAEIPITTRADGDGSTFYNRHGDWFGWSCVSLTAVMATFRVRRRREFNRN
jgi:apolipoprotein N-acyltransferase